MELNLDLELAYLEFALAAEVDDSLKAAGAQTLESKLSKMRAGVRFEDLRDEQTA